jgi:hypothetical protein
MASLAKLLMIQMPVKYLRIIINVTCSVYNHAVILAGHLGRIKEKNFVPVGKFVCLTQE